MPSWQRGEPMCRCQQRDTGSQPAISQTKAPAVRECQAKAKWAAPLNINNQTRTRTTAIPPTAESAIARTPARITKRLRAIDPRWTFGDRAYGCLAHDDLLLADRVYALESSRSQNACHSISAPGRLRSFPSPKSGNIGLGDIPAIACATCWKAHKFGCMIQSGLNSVDVASHRLDHIEPRS